ncbi:hypothetical protein Ddc_18065 [Ditylenchus destructor]|nr:hypothetical protein Ddc_18065 [Ditylenchus destructor]
MYVFAIIAFAILLLQPVYTFDLSIFGNVTYRTLGRATRNYTEKDVTIVITYPLPGGGQTTREAVTQTNHLGWYNYQVEYDQQPNGVSAHAKVGSKQTAEVQAQAGQNGNWSINLGTLSL